MSFFSQEYLSLTQRDESFESSPQEFNYPQGLRRYPSQDLNETRSYNVQPNTQNYNDSQASYSEVNSQSKYTRPVWATAGSGDKQKLQRPSASRVDASAHARRFQAEAQVRDMQHALTSLHNEVDHNAEVFIEGLQQTVEFLHNKSSEGLNTFSKNLLRTLEEKVESVSKFEQGMEWMMSQTLREIREKENANEGQDELELWATLHELQEMVEPSLELLPSEQTPSEQAPSEQFFSFASQVAATLKSSVAHQEMLASQAKVTVVATSQGLHSNLNELKNESCNLKKNIDNFASDIYAKMELLESSILAKEFKSESEPSSSQSLLEMDSGIEGTNSDSSSFSFASPVRRRIETPRRFFSHLHYSETGHRNKDDVPDQDNPSVFKHLSVRNLAYLNSLEPICPSFLHAGNPARSSQSPSLLTSSRVVKRRKLIDSEDYCDEDFF